MNHYFSTFAVLFARLTVSLLLLGTIFQSPIAAQSSNPVLEAIDLSNVARLEPISEVFSLGKGRDFPNFRIIPSSGSSRFLIADATTNNVLQSFDIETLEFGEAFEFKTNDTFTALVETVLSPDGRFAALRDFTSIQVWDTETAEKEYGVTTPDPENSEVGQIGFMSIGGILHFVYGINSTGTMSQIPSEGIHVVNIENGQEVAFLPIKQPLSIAISDETEQVAVGLADGEIYIWDTPANTSQLLREADGQFVFQIAYTQRFQLINITDTEVQLWRTDTFEMLPLLLREETRNLYYFGNGIVGTRSVRANLNDFQLWNIDSQSNLALVSHNVRDVSPIGNLLIVSLDPGIEFLDLQTGDVVHSLPDIRFTNALLTPDLLRLVTWSNDGNIQVWGVQAD